MHRRLSTGHYCRPPNGHQRRRDGYACPMEKDTNQQTESQSAESEVVEELLVEEISIDGMCGVY